MNTKIAWHYTTMSAFKKILKCGQIKSRALLVSERLQQLPDWDVIRRDPAALWAVLPEYMRDQYSFLRRRPIIWFSRQQHWEGQAGELTESKTAEWSHSEKTLSMMQTYKQGGGLVRFGLAEEKLLGIEQLFFTEYSLGYAAKAILFDRLCLGGINKRYVMGFVGDALSLNQVDRVDMFFPDSLDGEDGKGIWLPFMVPNAPNPVQANTLLTEYIEGFLALRKEQREARLAQANITEREDSNVTTKIIPLDCR